MNRFTIPGFEMIEELGAGGMATVWKARQISLDRIVAVKFLSANLSSDAASVDRFRAEAQAAAKLKHPGIVQVYDAHAEDGLYYFVMEYIAGYTVGGWMRRKGRLREKDALLVAECVADALQYAWETANIIHCDIKPENVMVDADGTVKVADLGLARTLSAMGAMDTSDEILGTPQYISPEQAMGQPDLDFRSDIYSLGAMLYHLVTGTMPFAGEASEIVMQRQVTGTLPDPLTVNADLSNGICWLIEKMMAKDRNLRETDWATVRKDILRVKKRLRPEGDVLPEGASTVERHERRMQQGAVVVTKRARHTGSSRISHPSRLWHRITAIAVLGIVLLFYVQVRNGAIKLKKLPGRPLPPRVASRKSVPQGPTQEDLARKATQEARFVYDETQKWIAANPNRYSEIISRLEAVLAKATGTRYAALAEGQLKRYKITLGNQVGAAMVQLEEETAPLLGKDAFEEAAKRYEAYDGELASETASLRTAKVQHLRSKQAQHDKTAAHRTQWLATKTGELLGSVADTLLQGRIDDAARAFGEALDGNEILASSADMAAVRRVLDGAKSMDDHILQTFVDQKGRLIDVKFPSGEMTLMIEGVEGDTVQCTRERVIGSGIVSTGFNFKLRDLSPAEKVIRMGSDEGRPDVALMKGVMAHEANADAHAIKYFERTHPLLAEVLLAGLGSGAERLADAAAERDLRQILAALDLSVGAFDVNDWVRALSGKTLASEQKERTRALIEGFQQRHGTSRFAADAKPVLRKLVEASVNGTAATKPAPSDRQAGAVAQRQFKEAVGDGAAVAKLLMARNEGLQQREITLTCEAVGEESDASPRVTGLRLTSSGVTDLGPVAALPNLQSFTCIAPSRTRGELKDIKPLASLPLEELAIQNCHLQDIYALKGMPLRRVSLVGTEVRDIVALRGSPIEELDLSNTKLVDVSVLSGMPLKVLRLNDVMVRGCSALKGLPLEELTLRNSKAVEFQFLSGMRLRTLDLSGSQFKDVRVLAAMPLKQLDLSSTRVLDLSPLAGMGIEELDLALTKAKDFSVIRTMPLKRLSLAGTRIEDLLILKDMPLTSLDISDTAIQGLWPLKGMLISLLDIENTGVADLAVLKAFPLKVFRCRGVPASDFGALRGLPIEHLWIDTPLAKPWLRELLPDLKTVNGMSLDAWAKAMRR